MKNNVVNFKDYDNSLADGMADFCVKHDIGFDDMKYIGMLCFYAIGAYFDGNGYELHVQLKKKEKER